MCRTRQSAATGSLTDASGSPTSTGDASSRRRRRRFHRHRGGRGNRRRTPFARRAQAAGLVQMASGGAAVAASVACRFEFCFAGFLAVGAWTGAFYAANGLLAVAAARTRLAEVRLAIGGMVLSLLAAMLGLMAIGMAVVGILVESDLKRYYAAAADTVGCDERCRSPDKRIFLHVVSVAAHTTQIAASCLQSILAFKRYLYFVGNFDGNSKTEEEDVGVGEECGEVCASLARGGNRSESIPLTERCRGRLEEDPSTSPPALVIRNFVGSGFATPQRGGSAAAPPLANRQPGSADDRNFCVQPSLQLPTQQVQQQQQQQQLQPWPQQFSQLNQHYLQQNQFHY